MPSGLRRYQSTGQHHFVTFSCDQRRPYLETTESKKMFEEILEATRLLYRFRIAGYVVIAGTRSFTGERTGEQAPFDSAGGAETVCVT